MEANIRAIELSKDFFEKGNTGEHALYSDRIIRHLTYMGFAMVSSCNGPHGQCS